MFPQSVVHSNLTYYDSNPSYYEFSEQQLVRLNPNNYLGILDTTVYESDEFRMYGFKIKKCQRRQRHDWTLCPFAHRGEKAKRRDPRRYNYAAVPCPNFWNGDCIRGETCQYAHGVFEYWLHPDKYRTRLCSAGGGCQRRVCFFAHSTSELRPDPIAKCRIMCQTKQERDHAIRSGHFVYLAQPARDNIVRSGNSEIGASSSSSSSLRSKIPQPIQNAKPPAVTADFLASLSGLRITENEETPNGSRFLTRFFNN